MDGSEGEGDLALIQTFLALLWKLFLKILLSIRITSGLKVSDQLVAYATGFLVVRLKNSCVIARVRRKTQSTVRLTYFRLYLRTRTRKTVYV